MLKVFKNVTERKTNIKLLNKFNFLQERLNGLIIKSRNNYLQTYDKQAKWSRKKFQTILVLIKMFFLKIKKYS